MNIKRLDAVNALIRFSRAAEKNQDKESIMLRDEIRSSGGLHSLLTLFRVPDTLYELRAIPALAAAYLVRALVEWKIDLICVLGVHFGFYAIAFAANEGLKGYVAIQ